MLYSLHCPTLLRLHKTEEFHSAAIAVVIITIPCNVKSVLCSSYEDCLPVNELYICSILK